MMRLSRRCFLLGACTSAGMVVRSAGADSAGALMRPIPTVPLSVGVAVQDRVPVRNAAWLTEQVDAMETLFAPIGVHVDTVSVRSVSDRYAHLETRSDRDALAAEVRPGVVNVFVVGTLRDVDEPSRMRRGVHWRNRTNGAVRYVIVASEAARTVLAHEMGHFFGNGHSATPDNLMSYTRRGGPVFLDAAQGRVIAAAARQAFASGELLGAPPMGQP